MGKISKYGMAATVAFTLTWGVVGCNKQSDSPTQAQDQENPSIDPASANMAPADEGTPANESASNSYQPPAAQPAVAPASRRPSAAIPATPISSPQAATSSEDVPPPPPDEASSYPADQTVPSADVSSDQSGYYDTSDQQQPVYAAEPPPAMPVYAQPPAPGPNYLWTPGYWSYQPTGYFWVPGVWVVAPYLGALWTPGFWGWGGGHYMWSHGYWGPHIGYYGGINYGHGYPGSGYYGGYWSHNNFFYNRTITNVNTTVVRNVYVRNVTINNVNINNYNTSRVAYNGGRGGLTVRPSAAELAASRERHMPPLAAQTQHMRQASQDREQFFNVNRGRPQTGASLRPLATSFHAPAAQPPARGVANPGFVQHQPLNHIAQQQSRPVEPQQQHPTAVSGARPTQQGTAGLIRPGANQGVNQPGHPGASPEQQHSGARPTPVERQEARPQPVQTQHPAETRPPQQQFREQPQHQTPVQEDCGARPVPVQRQEPRVQQPVPAQRQEMRSQPQPRPESRPAPVQHQEARPQGEQHFQEHSSPRDEGHGHGR